LQPIGPDEHATFESRKQLLDVLAVQLFMLDRAFKDTIAQAVPNSFRFRHDMRLALKAQAQCQASLKILLRLQHAAAAPEKFAKSSERTIGNGNPPG
jgi:hypothetical protein